MSGDVAASIYPLVQTNSMSHIAVQCESGLATTILHPLYKSPKSSLRNLSASFSGSFGDVQVCFPSTWEGEIISHLITGRVRHEWEGLQVLEEGSTFRASSGIGGQLYIEGAFMNVQLMAKIVAGSSREERLRRERERVPAVPGTPEMHREAGTRESIPVLDSPEDGQRREDEVEDDDDWIVVVDEDGAQKLTRRPPPTYEEAMMM